MSMKMPPSERIRQLLEGYLQGGYQQSEQPASEFLKLAAQVVAQEALEQEVITWDETVTSDRKKS